MTVTTEITKITLDMSTMVAIAALLLFLGEWIKNRVAVFRKYFIPAPVIGGLLFSIFNLINHEMGLFDIVFYKDMQNFLLLVFFTSVGFLASFELLKKGGISVVLFLACAVILVVIQNTVGVFLAKALGINPLFGLAAGSVSLTGGHGTSAAFGPIMEAAGAIGALPAAIAASTWGLVFGCVIGGPVGLALLKRYRIDSSKIATNIPKEQDIETSILIKESNQLSIMHATLLITICIGVGTVVVNLLKSVGITIPAYLGPMLVAALVRNMIDAKDWPLPLEQFNIMGKIALSFFLAMALMSMKLWEMASIAGPLLIILIIQTIIMALFAFFVTFKIMGRDYDAAVISAGHCGFGLGATPNAMANMEAFTAAHGISLKAFFVIPLVGSLFIDFFNASIITGFIEFFK